MVIQALPIGNQERRLPSTPCLTARLARDSIDRSRVTPGPRSTREGGSWLRACRAHAPRVIAPRITRGTTAHAVRNPSCRSDRWPRDGPAARRERVDARLSGLPRLGMVCGRTEAGIGPHSGLHSDRVIMQGNAARRVQYCTPPAPARDEVHQTAGWLLPRLSEACATSRRNERTSSAAAACRATMSPRRDVCPNRPPRHLDVSGETVRPLPDRPLVCCWACSARRGTTPSTRWGRPCRAGPIGPIDWCTPYASRRSRSFLHQPHPPRKFRMSRETCRFPSHPPHPQPPPTQAPPPPPATKKKNHNTPPPPTPCPRGPSSFSARNCGSGVAVQRLKRRKQVDPPQLEVEKQNPAFFFCAVDALLRIIDLVGVLICRTSKADSCRPRLHHAFDHTPHHVASLNIRALG